MSDVQLVTFERLIELNRKQDTTEDSSGTLCNLQEEVARKLDSNPFSMLCRIISPTRHTAVLIFYAFVVFPQLKIELLSCIDEMIEWQGLRR